MYYVDVIYPDGHTSDGTMEELPTVGSFYEGFKVQAVRETDEELEPGVNVYEVDLID